MLVSFGSCSPNLRIFSKPDNATWTILASITVRRSHIGGIQPWLTRYRTWSEEPKIDRMIVLAKLNIKFSHFHIFTFKTHLIRNEKRWHHMNFYFQFILERSQNYENVGFSISGLCFAFKTIFGLFSIYLTFRYLEHSKSIKFELFWSNFAIKTIFAENLAKWMNVNRADLFPYLPRGIFPFPSNLR